MRLIGRLAVVVALLPAGSACSPFGPCVLDQIHASFPATIAIGDALQEWSLTGRVSEGNLSPPLYDSLVAGLIDGTTGAAGTVFTLDQGFGDQAGFLAIWLGTDPAPGAVLTVTGAFDGGGWGVLPGGQTGARVAVLFGSFQATIASGTLTVLGTAPLRLDVDISVADASGANYGLAGSITFSRTIDRVRCS